MPLWLVSTGNGTGEVMRIVMREGLISHFMTLPRYLPLHIIPKPDG
jgi:hypothetical protein